MRWCFGLGWGVSTHEYGLDRRFNLVVLEHLTWRVGVLLGCGLARYLHEALLQGNADVGVDAGSLLASAVEQLQGEAGGGLGVQGAGAGLGIHVLYMEGGMG